MTSATNVDFSSLVTVVLLMLVKYPQADTPLAGHVVQLSEK